MHLKITHKTTYSYDEPVAYALQQLRLTPRSGAGQKVLDWSMQITGAVPVIPWPPPGANPFAMPNRQSRERTWPHVHNR